MKDHLAEATVQVGNLDRVRALVAPVEVLANPVNCEPIGVLQGGKIDHLRLWILANLAQLAKTRSVSRDVRPEGALGVKVVIQSYSVGLVFGKYL